MRLIAWRALPLALSLLTFTGCDSATAPQIDTRVDASGNWAGTITFTGVNGGGCAGETFVSLLPLTDNIRVFVQHATTNIGGDITYIREDGDDRDYPIAGTSSGAGIQFHPVFSSCVPFDFPCLDGRSVTFCGDSVKFEGTISGNRMTGVYEEIYRSSEGADLTLRGSFDLVR